MAWQAWLEPWQTFLTILRPNPPVLDGMFLAFGFALHQGFWVDSLCHVHLFRWCSWEQSDCLLQVSHFRLCPFHSRWAAPGFMMEPVRLCLSS